MIQKEVFSERLKAAMKKQNLKQIDLVRAAQVQGIKLGKSHVSQYVSGKTVPRTDILLFLAKTLQVEEEWLIGVSNVESDTEISATNRNILDTNKTILGNSNKENSEALTMSAKRQKSSIFEAEIISDINKNIQTTSAATISRNISNKEGKKMREFKKSSKLDNVLYDVRGPVVIRGCASSAAFWTSSWETSTILPSTPRSVITETPNTLMPQWFATITSGTVDMPTASAPRIWNILYSAGVSKVGPCVPIYTPCCTLMPFSLAISNALLISSLE